MANVGIIGFGFVGKAVEYGFKDKNNILIYDKGLAIGSIAEVVVGSEIIFVCVPTPMDKDYEKIDLSIVEEVTGQVAKIANDNEIQPVIVIKSTVVPGTTQRLSDTYKYPEMLFNPEFLTEANYLNDFVHADRVVIGGNKPETTSKLTKLYKESLPEVPIFETDPTSAEMVKYMANTFLATKIMFANEMYDLCQKLNINYKEVKKMVVADKRIFDSHMDISPDRGFGKKCFPKDIVALLGRAKELGVDMSVLDTVWKKNLEIRKVRDWEDIPGAVSKE